MSNYEELNAQQLVHKLEVAGEYPHPDLIEAIWERGEETRPYLRQLFQEAADDDWEHLPDDRFYRFVHAGKFLLAFQDEASLPTFARMYMDDRLQDWCEWFEEDPAVFGVVAIPHFAQVVQLDSGREWHYGRALCGSMLTKIAKGYPEHREEVAAIFRAQLPPLELIATLTEDEHDGMWSAFVEELAQLADEASREQTLALFDADVIDPMFIGRQDYLKTMNRGFIPEKLPEPYDIRQDYRSLYASEQERLKRLAAEKQHKREQSIQQAARRSGPKIGRNDPCPCGSGKKYKKCHGRPGSQDA